ncbi:hypothetical protein IVB11_35295 [Bradyrhizobium sp. 177]|uniref:hypothetical protein n=1 Tax=Bradyrhizobium sp. 177 TaxID=2782647 RepID=UPI001FF86030|nr:hypothetical protein [Bradyrhizobium sp. 177]MCK1554175.1 hypothetical protein [Bradyrhizobium sp. 177]
MSSYPNMPGYRTPGASKEAAIAVSGRARVLRKQIVAYLKSQYPKGRTADEIAEHFGLSLLPVRPRLAEAHYAREVEQTGERRLSRAGRHVNCWRAVLTDEEKGVRYG